VCQELSEPRNPLFNIAGGRQNNVLVLFKYFTTFGRAIRCHHHNVLAAADEISELGFSATPIASWQSRIHRAVVTSFIKDHGVAGTKFYHFVLEAAECWMLLVIA